MAPVRRRLQHAPEGEQHSGGRAPDEALTVGDVPDIDRHVAELHEPRYVVGAVQDELQGHLEGVVNLGAGDAQLERGIHESNRRRHAKAGADPMVGKVAGKFDEALRETDLLVRLAQRRMPGPLVMRLDASARESSPVRRGP